ncbi:IclR family transcriptional regulator [Catenovulum agarivorans DS-2]|uniref:HTH-type transcriptional repressor AllR n=1 Tax=Catenovulum agarivorans DS-2 TaxID=1328313 RepID=W7QTP7_9ALTE|nr:IclR family transcriptional regulator [Catenovulum agarivorans]EWH08805.1 IclR family transcriptional regulator [Catenovulum agarivorans DS-2]
MNDYLIPNLKNACKILVMLAESDRGLTASEIENRLDMPHTTVFRILKTLIHEQMASKQGRHYFAGNSLLNIGLQMVSTNKLRERAVPVLHELSVLTGFSSHLAVPSGYNSLIIEVCDSPRPTKIASRQGTLAPLHCSSTGKIFMAHLYANKIEDIFNEVGFEKRTDKTLTTVAQIKEELKKVVAKGYAMDEREYTNEVRCLAAPIYDYRGNPVAAIGITAHITEFTPDLICSIAKIVKEAGTKLYYKAELNAS